MGLFDFFKKNNVSSAKYNPKAINYKMDTLEQIQSIPVPTQKFEYNCDFTESIEYVLQRKATQFKKDGKMDLAIACLRKSNEIMPFAPMTYSSSDYDRLEKYLKLAEKFDEATTASTNTSETIASQKLEFHRKQLEAAIITGMIEVQRHPLVCSECARYHGRVYSQNGNNGFPNIVLFINYYNKKQCDCSLSIYPFELNASTPTICSKNKLVEYSNRPFEDDRTNSEKQKYNEYVTKNKADIKDRADYDWLCEHLPDKAPKSFGGYRNMKNKNSENYQKLIVLAKEKGYII